jgi:long-chain acyl-CoA synthetase
LATIVYTSGTTGVSKGAMHTFGTLAWAAQCGIRRVPLEHDGRMLSYLPLAHVAERTMVEHGQLATGAQVYFAESLDTFVADLQRARPTVFFSVPRLWLKFQQNILERIPRRKLKVLLSIPGIRVLVRRKILKVLGLDACKFAIGGAAPMPPELLRWYADLRLPIADVYGMTENGALSHSTLPLRQRIGTVGWPFEGVQSRLDPDSGEIQLRSGALMKGYFKAPELTRESFTADGWLRTGDKGVIHADDGALQIVGRVKELFKTSKGKYVAPAPIENRLVMHAGIDACAVVGADLPQPVGLVRLDDAAWAAANDPVFRRRITASLHEHLAALNAPLDPHERLDRLIVVSTPWTVESGLLTPTLKIRRHRLEELYRQQLLKWSESTAAIVWESA